MQKAIIYAGSILLSCAAVAQKLTPGINLAYIDSSVSPRNDIYKFANGKFAGVAIGLALTLIHLISIPITNTSVNPARSTSQAIFAGGESLSQLWLFWVAPIAGALLGGFIYKLFLDKKEDL